MCDYAWLTGHTRKAQPPEACTYFIAGEKLASAQESAEFLAGREAPHIPAGSAEEGTSETGDGGKPKRGGPAKYDWARALALYWAGANDGEIAREIGAKPNTVFQWRKRRGLPANAKVGGLHGGRAAEIIKSGS